MTILVRLATGFLAFALFGAGPAAAHRLKLFATVEGATISGYGFFVGGGRPEGVEFLVRDHLGTVVHRGTTDASGAFAWAAPRPDTYTVAIDTGDGHFAETTLAADRFAILPSATVPPALAPLTREAITAAANVTPSEPQAVPPVAAPTATGKSACVLLEPDEIARAAEPVVDRAVARQLRPLIEAQVATEGRVRFNDVMGGVGMIVGLAGLAAWAMSRRRDGNGGSRDRPDEHTDRGEGP